MKLRVGLLSLLVTLIAIPTFAQDSPLSFSGDVRFVRNTASSDAFGVDDPTYIVRARIGAAYKLNSQHSFKARLATKLSDELEEMSFSMQADGKGLSFGTVSFDELYYQYKKGTSQIKIGRFQHSLPVKSNAGRSIVRFVSNHYHVGFFDGLYWKYNLNEEWTSEFVLEYQNKDHTTFNYRTPLDFGNNDHNVAAYYGIENKNRDDLNIIQKGFGLYVAPGAYNKPDGYSSYVAFVSRIALDFPQESLQGGSIRVAGEVGQNLNTEISKGNIAVASVGIYNYAGKHQLMVELAKTGEQWLMANVYAPRADEFELRYRFLATKKVWFDARYRIRDFRATDKSTVYGTFVRMNVKF